MAKGPIQIDALRHLEATRLNIPTAEYESVMREEDKSPVQVAYERRNRDLDPQLVWRGKDQQDWSDLIVAAPPLYIQEKVHPKVLIDDLKRETTERRREKAEAPADLFSDFNGLKDREAETEFYQHDQHWSNRMILGDSLSVMASLSEREGIRGKVQCIYFDPPYGIRFNSNFQWSTTTKDVKDGAKDHFTREPEMVRAFRDTWRDGIHSYLTYIRDRMTVARDLLSEAGSIFVQIGDENIHRIRNVLDEVFGPECFVVTIPVKKKGNQKSSLIDPVNDYVVWYGKSPRTAGAIKFRPLFVQRELDEDTLRRFNRVYLPTGEEVPLSEVPNRDDSASTTDYRSNPAKLFREWPEARLFYPGEQITSGGIRANQSDPVEWEGKTYTLKTGLCWKTTTRTPDGSPPGMQRLKYARRLVGGKGHLNYKRFLDDFGFTQISNWWDGLGGVPNSIYVVQTSEEIVKRCILMTTDPCDLVLDPTCGSGTTAYVAEQWGRRWITIDTSRVSLALARARMMAAQYPYYILADSKQGQLKEAEITGHAPKTTTTTSNIKHGFLYERVPHVVMSDIANNSEIDVIWARWLPEIEAELKKLNHLLSGEWREWEVPRKPMPNWNSEIKQCHSRLIKILAKRQKEIDDSVSSNAESEKLFDRPYVDGERMRVTGPFTVESMSPHRTLAVGVDDELIDVLEAAERQRSVEERDANVLDFGQMVLENLRVAGVQQAHKDARISFTSIAGWPGNYISAEGRYMEGEQGRRAGILIGPEFGTVSRPDLVAAAREAGDAGFDMVIACAFNFDAHSAEFDKLGRVPVLKARMNPDLMMGNDLKATGAGNLFVVFGEPDIKIENADDGMIRVRVFGVDVFKPQTGEIVSEGTDGIALWMLDTDYNEESFFVRHAYFLGANDPYKALKTSLKAEIDEAAWSSLYSDVSRAFPKPKSGRIAVKVINHLGDEVMKVFGV